MQVEELVGFLQWLDSEVRKPNIIGLYAQLREILAVNSSPGQPKQPFEDQRKSLLDGVMKPNINLLNRSQVRFAEKMLLFDLIGPKAMDAIEDVLFKNVIDVATATQKISQFHDSLNTILQKASKISEGLSQYVETVPIEYEEALVHIRFQRDASIKNIVDLREWGNSWFEIGRGIALANKLPPEDIKVIGASRGSIVYDLAVAYAVASTLTGIILLVLKVADRILEVKKKAEEIRGMKLSNDKAAQELDREATQIEKDGHAEVLSSIKATKTLDGEQSTALSNAITKIFNFVLGGGEVDVHIRSEQDTKEKTIDPKVIAEIKQSFSEIKRLEAKIRLLKDKNN